MMGGVRRGPPIPLDDDGWGWLSFGLDEMQTSIGRLDLGLKQLDDGLDKAKFGVEKFQREWRGLNMGWGVCRGGLGYLGNSLGHTRSSQMMSKYFDRGV